MAAVATRCHQTGWYEQGRNGTGRDEGRPRPVWVAPLRIRVVAPLEAGPERRDDVVRNLAQPRSGSTGATSVITSALGGTIHIRSARGAGTAITEGLPLPATAQPVQAVG